MGPYASPKQLVLLSDIDGVEFMLCSGKCFQSWLMKQLITADNGKEPSEEVLNQLKKTVMQIDDSLDADSRLLSVDEIHEYLAMPHRSELKWDEYQQRRVPNDAELLPRTQS